jgi:N-methylhydantoinase A
VDVGGTFTDVVLFDGETVTGGKVPTTARQELGVLEAIERVGGGRAGMFLHGTTIGTNALLEGRGARVALVTTPGFEDVIEIGRQARPSLYDPFADHPATLVPREMRVGANGDLHGILDQLKAARPDAVAVALVRSYSDPSEERELATELAKGLGVPVSVGANVSPGFREYERIATTALDAYLSPEVSGYLSRLGSALEVESRLVMTSAGGLLPFQAAVGSAGRLVLSGPAAGVVAAAELASAKGHSTAFSFDMGGTSTDVCRIADGEARVVIGRKAAGRVNRVPTLPINTIGAGGGSIAWADEGGALRVGPQSAGADPGPAAYGRGGTVPTVTDANLLLGHLPPDLALAGTLRVSTEAAEGVLERLGRLLGLDTEATAAGVIEVVDAHMERAIRSVSVEEGIDPRGGALIAFGGAGGLHAGRLARRLGIGTVLVPPFSGVFSALGLLMARPRADAIRTVFLEEGPGRLSSVIDEVRQQARTAFAAMKVGPEVSSVVDAEVRYVGQSHEVSVPVDPDWVRVRERFEDAHRSRFGFDRPDEPIQIVDIRAEVTGSSAVSWSDLPPNRVTASPDPIFTSPHGSAVWPRDLLPAGFETRGPALIVERDSVTLLELGDQLSVHSDGTLEVRV